MMTLDEFSQLVHHMDQEKEMHKYFDEHLALHSLLARNFSNDITIDLKEDDTGCYYMIHPSINIDLTYMQNFYDNIKMNFFSHRYLVKVSIQKEKTIMIRFVNK